MELTHLDLEDTYKFSINEMGEILYRDADALRVIPSRDQAITLYRRAKNWQMIFGLALLLLAACSLMMSLSFLATSGLTIVFGVVSVLIFDSLRKPLRKWEPRIIRDEKTPWQKGKELFLKLSSGQLLFLTLISCLMGITLILPALNPMISLARTVIAASPFLGGSLALFIYYIKRHHRETQSLEKAEQETVQLRLELMKSISGFLTTSWIAILGIALTLCWIAFLKNINDLTIDWLIHNPDTDYAVSLFELSERYVNKAFNIILYILFILFFLNLCVRRVWIICGKPVKLFTERYPFNASWESISHGLWVSLISATLAFCLAYTIFAFRDDLPMFVLEQFNIL